MAPPLLNAAAMLIALSSVLVLSSLSAPVVGGSAVMSGEWPDAVGVLAANAACTGTLIAPDVVLTAGHCIETHPRLVVTGIDFLHPHDTVAVKSATAYPDWQHTYDVGVLVLEHPLAVAPRAVAAACTAKEHLVAGAEVRVVGFGLTSASGTGFNSTLHEAMLPVVDPTCTHDPACAVEVAPGGEFTAGGHGTDACFGDSGGPIYVQTMRGAALIGVVSRGVSSGGRPCAAGGVYVRADKVVPWIERITGRKLTRATCDRPADDGGEGQEADDAGGCAVGGGVLGGGTLVVVALFWLLTAPRRGK